jgi:divalent metal cation (Fe/Co/Zn/Cd) transporter
VGILFARLGYPVMDAVASVVISVCIVKAACDIFKDGLDKMVDHSCDAAPEASIRAAAAAVAGVERIDLLRTRLFGDKIYVDMEIAVDGEMKLVEAHAIAEGVHHAIERAFPVCKHCMVHVNPAKASAPAQGDTPDASSEAQAETPAEAQTEA